MNDRPSDSPGVAGGNATLPARLVGATVTVTRHGEPEPGGLRELSGLGGGEHLRVHADGGRAVIWADRVGHICVEQGRKVAIHPQPGLDDEYLAAYLYGLVATLVLGQQKRFALHASTVAVDGTRVALSGNRGAGKTTTSLSLVARGAEPVTDDLTVLDVDDPRVHTVSIGRPLHVWPDTIEMVGLDLGPAVSDGADGSKLTIPWVDAEPGEVAAVVVLVPDDVSEPVIGRLSGSDAFVAVDIQTSWRTVVSQIWPTELFAWRATVAHRLPVFELRRPREGWPLDDLCERIEGLVR
ncbi:MAG: hypothetical protein RIE08_07685 [Acidimicrobiales bacterium]